MNMMVCRRSAMLLVLSCSLLSLRRPVSRRLRLTKRRTAAGRDSVGEALVAAVLAISTAAAFMAVPAASRW